MRVLQIIARGLASSMTLVLSKPKASVAKPVVQEAKKLTVENDDPVRQERRVVAGHGSQRNGL